MCRETDQVLPHVRVGLRHLLTMLRAALYFRAALLALYEFLRLLYLDRRVAEVGTRTWNYA